MTLNNLRFDEASHTYSVGDRNIPSVTQLMQKYYVIDTKFYNLQAMFRGTYVHKACQFYDEGDLNTSTLDPIVLPFFEAYIRFIRESGFKVDLETMEKPMYSKLGYAGTLDRTGHLPIKGMDDIYIMADIKTGSVPKWINIQLGAYKNLLLDNGFQCPLKYYALNLRADGSYRFVPVPNTEIMKGWEIFTAMLKIENSLN